MTLLARRTLRLVRAHWSAFREDQLTYLRILGWRLRGLRLRSRQHFATLLGRSSAAYDLWLASECRERQPHPPQSAGAHFVPIIDCSLGSDQLVATIESLHAAGCEAVPLLVSGDGEGLRQALNTARVDPDQHWFLIMAAGDRIAPGALASYAEAANQEIDLIYADDDLISPAGRRYSPHLKPDWNPDLFEWHDYVTGACAIRGAAVRWECLPSGDWAAAMVSDALRSGTTPTHVKKILHHRLVRPDPCLPERTPPPALSSLPPVSVIVPIRNGLELLQACLAGLAKTDYPGLEVIIADNGSDEPAVLDLLHDLEAARCKVLRMPGPFNFSLLNNHAVRHAAGTYFCFLNNDVEVIEPDWLRYLVAQAERSDVGAVGARLLYPDGTIQHAGVVTGISGAAGHAHRQQHAEESGYFHRSHLPQRVSAVTAACMVVAKDKFLAVGGFNEEAFPVAFNDVDLCLRLQERGWHSFYEPRATLVHHESKSRGKDVTVEKRRRFEKELAALQQRWNTDQRRDPYHHPDLSAISETFVLNLQ